MGGRGCSSPACSRGRPHTCGAGQVSGQASHPSSSLQASGWVLQQSRGAPAFLPDHTLQDLPLVLVQAHGKGAAVRADYLHLVHFDLRRANLEGRPGSARSPGPELPASSLGTA